MPAIILSDSNISRAAKSPFNFCANSNKLNMLDIYQLKIPPPIFAAADHSF